ncbi:hypothetical protein BH11BAC4_BH11BAC4_15020 [soil metagenome]
MRSFIILLPNEKAKTYSYVTLFMLLINCLVFGYVFFKAGDRVARNISLLGNISSFISLISFLVNFFTGRFKNYRPGISFIILSILWFMLGNYLLGVCTVLVALIGYYAKKKFNVLFTEDSITYPTFPQKIFGWNAVSNVVLKDNVLTIDLKNNKLIQSVVEKESAEQVDENSFNEFCRERLKSQVFHAKAINN